MKESLPPQHNEQENTGLLYDADYVINALWEKIMAVNDLPLSVDSDYRV